MDNKMSKIYQQYQIVASQYKDLDNIVARNSIERKVLELNKFFLEGKISAYEEIIKILEA